MNREVVLNGQYAKMVKVLLSDDSATYQVETEDDTDGKMITISMTNETEATKLYDMLDSGNVVDISIE